MAGGAYRYEAIRGSPLSTTDAHGFRNGLGWDADGEAPIVLFVGDSAVFGAEVADDETIPSQVYRLLSPRHSVRVLNAGVRGYSAMQAFARMDEVLERFPNVAAVVFVSSPNDFVENLNPITRYPLVAPVVRWDSAGNWLETIPPENIFPEGTRLADRPQRPIVRLTRWLRRHSGIVHHVGMRVRTLIGTPEALRAREQRPDGAVGPIDEGMPQWEAQRQWAEARGGSEAMRMLLRNAWGRSAERGIPFVVTAFTRGDEPWHTTLRTLADEAGVPFFPVEQAFSGPSRGYAAERRDGLYDPHYNALGSRTFAEAIAPTLDTLLLSIALP